MLKIIRFVLFYQREKIKMSTAWKHLDVYEELTDNIFERILIENNEKEDMEKAQELIKNVYKRNLYKRVDETTPEKVFIFFFIFFK